MNKRRRHRPRLDLDGAIQHVYDVLRFRVDDLFCNRQSGNQKKAADYYNSAFGRLEALKLARLLYKKAMRNAPKKNIHIVSRPKDKTLGDIESSTTPAEFIRRQQS